MRGEAGGLQNQKASNSDPLRPTAGQRTHPGPCSLQAKRGGKLTILENTGFSPGETQSDKRVVFSF